MFEEVFAQQHPELEAELHPSAVINVTVVSQPPYLQVGRGMGAILPQVVQEGNCGWFGVLAVEG